MIMFIHTIYSYALYFSVMSEQKMVKMHSGYYALIHNCLFGK